MKKITIEIEVPTKDWSNFVNTVKEEIDRKVTPEGVVGWLNAGGAWFVDKYETNCKVENVVCEKCGKIVLNDDEWCDLERHIDAVESVDAGEFSSGFNLYEPYCGCKNEEGRDE